MVADRTIQAAALDNVLTVMIVDDEPAALRTLREYIALARALDPVTLPQIVGEADGRMHVLDVGHIEMIESERNYIRLTVGRRVYTTRSTLQHAETSLSAQPMLRVSRSCLVNMDHVREISRTPRGDVIMQLAGGATVTSSERFRAAVREELHRMQLWPRES
jgi:two-component system, LytTR family, response regulator